MRTIIALAIPETKTRGEEDKMSNKRMWAILGGTAALLSSITIGIAWQSSPTPYSDDDQGYAAMLYYINECPENLSPELKNLLTTFIGGMDQARIKAAYTAYKVELEAEGKKIAKQYGHQSKFFKNFYCTFMQNKVKDNIAAMERTIRP